MFLLLYGRHVRDTTWRLHTKLYKFRWNCGNENPHRPKSRRCFLSINYLSYTWFLTKFIEWLRFLFSMQTTNEDLLGINMVLLLWTRGALIFISKFKFSKMSVQVLIQSNQRSENLCHECSRNHLYNAAPTSPPSSPDQHGVKRNVTVTCGMAQCFRSVFC